MSRTATLGSVIAAVIILPIAMLGAQTPQTKPESSTPSSPARSAEADSDFLRSAAAAGMAEVELGKLGIQNASGAEVRHFAEKMVEDHSKANGELTALAGKKGVILPKTLEAKHKAIQSKLAKLHGPAFDSAYIAQMLADHKAAVALFQRQAETGSDPDVKAWAAKTLPTLQLHLKTVQTLPAKR